MPKKNQPAQKKWLLEKLMALQLQLIMVVHQSEQEKFGVNWFRLIKFGVPEQMMQQLLKPTKKLLLKDQNYLQENILFLFYQMTRNVS